MPSNPFNLPTGGLDQIEATITEPQFVLHDELTDTSGNALCVLRVLLDPEDGEHEPWPRDYATGPGWEPTDGGKRVVRADDPDDDEAQFNGQTRLGRLITAIVAVASDEIAGRYNEGNGIGANEAAMFDGLRFHWANDEQPKRVRDDATGEWTTSKTEKSSLLLPDEFIGVVGGGKKPAKKAPAKKSVAKKAAAKPKAKVEAEQADAPDEMPEEMVTALKELYEACEGSDDWLEAALEIDGIDPWLDKVNDLQGGVWDDLVEQRI